MKGDLLKARSIFISAVEQYSPDEWDTFLSEACGDDAALRRRVEALLRAHQDEDSFLDRGAGENSSDIPPASIAERPGTTIGPYTLLEQIGEGGFGVVFLAQQERPVRRCVALKVIKPGMDTRQVVARFEAERQALAMMDHPNIAKVLDAGTTEHGRPYFVMELVRGVPITEYCMACTLTTSERLELVITVCKAVQHAHQKGVIHRDLKPTNVLVAMTDNRPEPKIIDFGVAKAIHQQLTDHTLMTAFSQVVGTPLYMSPEQAELSPLGVDTRTDIYSLGVLLYELLTGTTPFDKDRLCSASYDELRRIIREEEPPRPSVRISTLDAETATTIAQDRRTDVRRLKQTVRGELDWIVMKCLEKDRNRRYDSASGLARDLERYLHDEPVQAFPPSAPYRLRKLLRRNKVATAFVALLTVGFVMLAVSNVMIQSALTQKNEALTLALRNEVHAVREGRKSKTISQLLLDMLASSNPDRVKGSDYTLREWLEDFSAGLGRQLDGEPEVEAAIQSVIGTAFWRLGMGGLAETHLKRALDLRRELYGTKDERVAESLVDYAWSLSEQGRSADAERHVREALTIFRKQNSNPQSVVRALWSLQRFLITQSRLTDAEEVAKEAIALASKGRETDFPELPALLHGLADVKIEQHLTAEAEHWARRSVDLHRRVHGDHHPETAWGLLALGRALKGQQEFAAAEIALRESVAIFREHYASDHTSLQTSISELKSVLEAKGDRIALEAFLKEEDETKKRSDSPENHIRLVGLLLMNNPTNSQKDEARRLVRQASDELQQVAVEHPVDIDRRAKALFEYIEMIKYCASTAGFAAEVDELNRRLEAELPRFYADFPDSRDCQWYTASLYRNWAAQLLPFSDYQSMGEAKLRESIALHETLTQTDPDRLGVWLYLADRNIFLGYVYWLTGRPEGAEAASCLARDIIDQHESEQTSTDLASALNTDSICLAYYFGCTHREDEAARFLRKAVLSAKQVAAPGELAETLYWTALAQIRLGDTAGYRESCKALVDIPIPSDNDIAKAVRILAWCLAPNALEDLSLPVKRAEELAARNTFDVPHFVPFVRGIALYRDGQYERAFSELEKSIAVYPAASYMSDRTINCQRLVLAMTQWQRNQRAEACQLLEEIRPVIDQELAALPTAFDVRLTLEVLRREAEDLIVKETRDTNHE